MDNLGITGQMILHDFLIGLGFLGAGIFIYSFWKAIFQKNKRCAPLSCLCTGIVVILCVIFWYGIHRTPNVVQMHEDVLYIHPKSEMPKDLYDGTKNDPNTKEDTFVVKK